MHGRISNVIKFVDALKAFKAKLQNWKRKIEIGNCAMFEKLDIVLDNRGNKMPEKIKEDISKHLSALQNEFEKYFAETSDQDLDFVRNPFKFPVEKLPDECQDEFLELINDSSARQEYEKLLPQFWIGMKNSYPETTAAALRILIPFVSTYSCESGFSSLVQIKSKQRNRLDVKDDMRCALSQTLPRVQQLTDEKQEQISH